MKREVRFGIRGTMGRRGQIWVETVIYTLIGLAIIGLVLATALPKINEKKDEVIIEQSIEALKNIDDKIYDVINKGTGNRRVIDLKIKEGIFIIDMEENSISWILDSSFQYSEENIPISLGRLNVTTRAGNPWEVELKSKYPVDIQYDEEKFGTKQLDIAPTPYRFTIENNGKNEDGEIIIGLNEV